MPGDGIHGTGHRLDPSGSGTRPWRGVIAGRSNHRPLPRTAPPTTAARGRKIDGSGN